jgi:protein O-mannosyl-transferase
MLEPPGPLMFISKDTDVTTLEPASQVILTGNTQPSWRRWRLIACAALIAALGISLYAHTLRYPFQFDDHIYLVGSEFITDMKSFVFGSSFHEIVTHSEKVGLGSDPSVNFILRPIAYLTFHLNYLQGGFDPAGFRAVNIAIHCSNGILLFLLLSHILRKSPLAADLPASSQVFIPLATALLFVSHPLHTESVTYIVQRFTSLVCFFVLLSIWLQFLSLSAQRRISALWFRTLAVLATIAGMLTKESMFTAPLLMVILHIVVMRGTLKNACWQAMPHLLCMLIIPAMILITSHVQSGEIGLVNALHIAASTKDSAYPIHYFMTQLGVVLEYVRLIIWPEGLNIDRQYPLATSFLELRVWLSATVIAGILICAWRLYRSKGGQVRYALICAGVFWFFLRLAVSSSFVPLDDLMVDHRTYGASIGILLALVCCLDLLRTHAPRWAVTKLTVPSALAIWIALLSVSTLNRNDVWQSETSLWSDAVMKSPGKARPWDNLGVCHYEEGREYQALACLSKSNDVDTTYVPSYVKLGFLCNALKKHVEAAEWSRKGLLVAPHLPELHYNLGVAQCALGQTVPEGLASIKRTIQYRPTHAEAHLGLGQIYRHLQDYPNALHHYRIAATLTQESPQLATIIAQLELQVGHQQVSN